MAKNTPLSDFEKNAETLANTGQTEKQKETNIALMTAGGIIMPMLTNRWRINSISILDEAETDIVTLQAISLKYKFAPSMFGFAFANHDLSLIIEEPIGGQLAPIVKKLMTEKFDLSYSNMDGDFTPLKTTTFKGCIGVSYEYKMDYADSSTCKYPLKFKCEDIIYS